MPSRKSVGEATAKSFNKVKALLKERGITVEAIDGPSQDDKELRFLQELQQIEQALENSAREGNSAVSSYPTVSASAGAMDSGTPETSKSSKRGI